MSLACLRNRKKASVAGVDEQEGGEWYKMRLDSYVPSKGSGNHVRSLIFVQMEAMEGADTIIFCVLKRIPLAVIRTDLREAVGKVHVGRPIGGYWGRQAQDDGGSHHLSPGPWWWQPGGQKRAESGNIWEIESKS